MTRPEPPPAQAAVEQARAGLLGGRGPGASQAEIARHTRARRRLGTEPTADARAALAWRTACARRDVDAVAAHAAVATDALGDTIAAIRHRADPARVAAGVRVDLTTLALAVLAAVVATTVLVRRGARGAR